MVFSVSKGAKTLTIAGVVLLTTTQCTLSPATRHATSEIAEVIAPSEERARGQATVQKWTEPIRVYVAVNDYNDRMNMLYLFEHEFWPLVQSLPTGSPDIRAYDTMWESGFVLAASKEPAMIFKDLPELESWYRLGGGAFDPVEASFTAGNNHCFRHGHARAGRMTRVIAFVSMKLPEVEAKKCLARHILFAFGLRGETDNPNSALSSDAPSRPAGSLDREALNFLYNPGVKPGMALGEALGLAYQEVD